VRELFNVVRRAFVLADGMQILPSHLAVSTMPAQPMSAPTNFRQARVVAVETFERTYVDGLLRKHAGNVTRAAREAVKDRRAFGRLVKKYGIDRRAV
jgi:DNA-binding NtrC family response regulator